ncbi:MAG TPA: pantoate--beta-alanine ligase [Gemmatimonadaceae bacterium]|nr:pantoate--beta-alanine ligase [Gemmatimonadaceae bacterium]
MKIVGSIAALRQELAPFRGTALLGFVPTMGALHAGHGRLLERARAECGVVVASVFVNPLQFDRRDDFEGYPRDLESDAAFCAARGVDFLFAPSGSEMYPAPPATYVDVVRLGDHLCGRYRPGHFRGVATVVVKLFNIVQPDRAYFGEKDRQQLAIVRRIVRDLDFPVQIVAVETVREPDGLALSSRNVRLDAAGRSVAPVLYRALAAAASLIERGETSAEAVRERAIEILRGQPSVRLEYLEVVDADEMQPVQEIAGPVVVAGAIWIGDVRLIDNVAVAPR